MAEDLGRRDRDLAAEDPPANQMARATNSLGIFNHLPALDDSIQSQSK